MSAGRNLMNANTAARDTYLFDDRKSQWLPEGWSATANWHGEWKDLSPNTTADLGGKTIFQVQDTLMDYAGAFVLVFEKGAWTQNDGTINRMVDFAGYQFIKTLTINYGSNFIKSFTGYELQTYYHRMLMDRDKQDAIGRLVGGDQDAATRTTDFTGTRKYYVPIPLWIDDTKKALPLSVLSHEINFEVTWAVLNELVQSDGTPVASSPGITASSQKLRIFHVHVPSDEQAYLQQMSDTEDGLLYLINDANSDASKEVTVSSGSTSFSHRLTNVKSPIVEFIITLRKKTDADTTLQADKEPFLRQEISTIKITGSGLDIVPTLEHDFLVNYISSTFHSGPPSENIYIISHSTNPEDGRDCFGSLNYFNINNPQLELTFSALPEDMVLDVYPVTKNMIQFKSGDVKRVFV